MKQCLIEVIGVREERIQTLFGPGNHRDADKASIPFRANIVSTLRNLSKNPDIKHGDPIIFYFAGHGSRYAWSDLDNDEVHDSNTEDNSERVPARAKFVEALCPMDRDAVPDISDRELNTIFSRISSMGGNPISVILDCCHSGGATRSVGVRTIPSGHHSLRVMLRTGEEGLKDFVGYRSILAENWSPDMDSHVFVAACGESESAREVWLKEEKGAGRYSGAFTSALIDVLRSGRLGKGATYEDLNKALPRFSSHTPVIEGGRKRSCLWYQV